eukprot:scaffold14594_cov127-Isochrysis_galbana.AAC.3
MAGEGGGGSNSLSTKTSTLHTSQARGDEARKAQGGGKRNPGCSAAAAGSQQTWAHPVLNHPTHHPTTKS